MIDYTDNENENCQNQIEYVQFELLARHSNVSQIWKIFRESGLVIDHESGNRERECSTAHKHLMTMPEVASGSE